MVDTIPLMHHPLLQSTKETLAMVLNYYPERLGHCIMYKMPAVAAIFINGIKKLCDPKTASKIVMIHGDSSDGTRSSARHRLCACQYYEPIL
jgi:hypothetical protein